MSRRFTLYVLVAMLLGIAAGYAIDVGVADRAAVEALAGYLSLVTDVFLRLIKMIIGPLVFATLVAGIAHMGGSSRALGRIGLRTMAWFIGASLVSLLLGIVMAMALQPGAALNLPLPAAGATAAVQGSALSLRDFVVHLVPKSFFEAMATNEILQIVVFSVFVGVAMASLGERARAVREAIDQLVLIMLKITGYVMWMAPAAVFAALASTVATQGLGILASYGKFIGGFYAALVLLWALLLGAGALAIGPTTGRLVGQLRAPMLLAFSTASSEAAYPRTLEQLERFGVSKRIASFVLPLGYSFNLVGSMTYCTFATIFIAQAYGIDLGWGQLLTMLMLLMVTSKGMAGVPRASLVVIAATLTFFDLPEAGLLLILAVDHFLDMGRSATNVLGNALAAAAIARWEGELTAPDATRVKPATA